MGETIAENQEASGGKRKAETAWEKENMESGEEEKAIQINLSFCSLVLSSVLHSRPIYHQGCAKLLYM